VICKDTCQVSNFYIDSSERSISKQKKATSGIYIRKKKIESCFYLRFTFFFLLRNVTVTGFAFSFFFNVKIWLFNKKRTHSYFTQLYGNKRTWNNIKLWRHHTNDINNQYVSKVRIIIS